MTTLDKMTRAIMNAHDEGFKDGIKFSREQIELLDKGALFSQNLILAELDEILRQAEKGE